MQEKLKEEVKTESITVDIVTWLTQQGYTEIPLDQVTETLCSYLSVLGITFNKSEITKWNQKHLNVLKSAGYKTLSKDFLEAALAEIYKVFKFKKLESFYKIWESYD